MSTASEREPIVHIVDDDRTDGKAFVQAIGQLGRRTKLYSKGEDFLETYDDRDGGCLILDMIIKEGMSGLALLDALEKRFIVIPTIVVTAQPTWPVAVYAMKHGAIDYIKKPIDNLPTFLDIVERGIRQDRINRSIKASQLEVSDRLSRLTPKERLILNDVLEDKSSAEVAVGRGISRKTVEFHRANVLVKMGVRSTIQLVRLLCRVDAEVGRLDAPQGMRS